jgi:predicted kinase
MHGFSGSGKTWISNQLARALPAVRVRSDIERKRMYGYGDIESSHSEVCEGIYTAAASSAVYKQLAKLTATLVHSGHNSIVDASFLKLTERNRIRDLADRLGVRFRMVDTFASSSELTHRLHHRDGDASEANINVLQHQLASADPLTPAERRTCISIDTEAAIDLESILSDIRGKKG